MKAYEKYFDELNKVVKKVEETNGEAIMKAATLLADVTQKGGIIYGFGTGHSHLVVDDAFWRAERVTFVGSTIPDGIIST